MVVFCLIMYVTFISLVQLFLDVLETDVVVICT